jgi:ribosomal protein S18 acetylase RimI-like enzyme
VIEVRRAVPEDAPELVRLRVVMYTGLPDRTSEPGPWQAAAEETLRKRLAEPEASLAAFVVDRPDRPGELASCAIGTIEYRLAGPENPAGTYGYVFNVATDPDCRRRGYSRACMEALLGWYRQRGVRKVDLHTSAAAEPLYRSLGFVRPHDPALRLHLW